ncbi:MAG: lysophospholipase [Gemmataceae bacterium]|nr:lysophospholipase [Gemmataceae bacterium]
MGESPEPFLVEEFAAGDGYRWRYRRFAVQGAPKAEVVFLHGIQSHAGWYEYSSMRLCQAGFAVSFLDRRGSGMNAQERGDTPGFRRLIEDVAEYLQSLPRTAPRGHSVAKLPVFLGAISWGGKLAVALERRHPGLVDGLMLLCPGFFPRIRPSLGQRLRIVFARFLRPRKLFHIPLNDPELFTATPRWLEFLRGDPLRLQQATARFLVESVRLDRYIRVAPKYVHVPTLLLLAENDRIIQNDKTRAFVERFATPDKQIKEYAGAQHTLEFEPNPDRHLDDLLGWLEQHARIDAL